MKKLFLYYFIFLFSLLSIFSSGVIDSQDGFQYLAVARNIYYTGKPTAPPYEYDTRKNVHMSVVTGKDENMYSLTGLGYSLAYLPAVALTDIVYKFYGLSPPVHFPLENDWLIFLIAGFTNAFIGAILGVILLAYFILLGLSKKQALICSLISIFATNLFVYTKHSMPHMMFITFLMLSFLLIKLYSLKKKSYLILFSGLSFGVFIITYNQTFGLAIPPLILYYMLLYKEEFKRKNFKNIFKQVLLFMIGVLPFIFIYAWYEDLKALKSTSNLFSVGINYLSSSLPIGVFFEGIYGQLVSPGRSIFIYSPLLLMIVFFWNRIKKNVHPELFVFLLYSVILIIFYAKAITIGRADQGIEGLWHGENSWGPRYLTPLIPLGMLVVASIYKFLSKKEKYFVFFPLVAVGLLIEIIGVLIPYQTKYANLEKKFFINGRQYTVFVYSNLLPRYTPLLTMSKNFIKLNQNFPKTFDHGIYNVKFYDGMDFPFNVGSERWRVIEGDGYISFDNNNKNPVSEIALGLINHPVSASSSSASLKIFLNDKQLLEEPTRLVVTERNLLRAQVEKGLVKDRGNKLIVQVRYDEPKVLETKGQILGLQFFEINSNRINMESIDVPYVSPLGPKIAGVTYQNWGGTNKDPWRFWDIHTQTFERVPDFWWVRNLYYWDIPKSWILTPLILNLLLLAFSGFKLKKELFKSFG